VTTAASDVPHSGVGERWLYGLGYAALLISRVHVAKEVPPSRWTVVQILRALPGQHRVSFPRVFPVWHRREKG
jgi:hypothetical protein